MESDLITKTDQILDKWLVSCTTSKGVSRNTVAIGIVVFDHLRNGCPVVRAHVVSKRGEIKGARSGLHRILTKYGIPRNYLKEVTTRQAHQDAQRLFQELNWGGLLSDLPEAERDQLLKGLIERLRIKAASWIQRQNLKLQIDRRQAPMAWIHLIVDSARQRSAGVVEQHLVGAKLARRFKGLDIPNHPAHAGDAQTARGGDFAISKLIYHVTATPSRAVIQKCSENLTVGLHPILLVPSDVENRAKVLAQDEGIGEQLTIMSIEDFVSLNIIELATEEHKDFFAVLKEIVDIYNKRLASVETDLSLQIEVQ